MKNRLNLLFKVLVAILLLCYLFSKVEITRFFTVINSANIFLICIASLMSYVGVYISILKWDIFLNNYGINISKLKLYSIYSISTFLNNFLPTTIGGDFYRIIHINKKILHKKKEVASSVILERGIGFFSLFLINFLLAPLFYELIIFNSNFLFLEIIILLFFILLLLFTFQYTLLINITKKLIKREILIMNKFHSLMVSLANIKDRKIILYSLIYSFIFSLAIASSRFILFYAFNLEINFWYILFTSSIIQIIGLIPISLNSIGITEGLSVFLLSLIGVPLEISLAVALIGRVSLLITSSFGGLFYFINDRIKY